MKTTARKLSLLFVLIAFGLHTSAQLPPGWDYQATPLTQIISIPATANPNIGGIPLSTGDWIGVFFTTDDGELTCGGASEWTPGVNNGIIAFGDDAFSSEKDGFASGEVITYKFYSYQFNMEYLAEPTCDAALQSACDLYSSNGLSGVVAIHSIQQFTPIWESPYNPMTFYITAATVNELDMQAGDEIGIFDVDAYNGAEICVGAGILTEALTGGAYLEVIASMDDGSFANQSNGFTPGNDFGFQLYSQIDGLIQEVVFTFPYPGYDETFTSLGSAFVELAGETEPGITFEPVWTSPYNPMTFYFTEALLDDVDLGIGAQIGIFDIDPNTSGEICVGAATLAQVITPESFLEIIASMDDGSLPNQANGFTPGNDFIFKFISATGILIEEVTYDFPYSGYDEVFTSQGNAIVNLSGSTAQNEQQVISLPAGWMGVSSYLDPAIPAIENVCAAIAGQLQMLNNLQAFYQPGNTSSTLDVWNYQSGYFIKLNEAVALTINGNLPENTTINLTVGWNLIPVLADQPVAVDDLFAGQLAKVEIIKDAVGLEVYWPGKSIATLQDLYPGKSYLIKATENFIISY